jgi:hypothetical protein
MADEITELILLVTGSTLRAEQNWPPNTALCHRW